MLNNLGVVDPPHIDIPFAITTHAPRLHIELTKVFGDRLIGVSTGPYGTVIHLTGIENDKDKEAAQSVLDKHDPTPPPTPLTLGEIIANLVKRVENIERNNK